MYLLNKVNCTCISWTTARIPGCLLVLHDRARLLLEFDFHLTIWPQTKGKKGLMILRFCRALKSLGIVQNIASIIQCQQYIINICTFFRVFVLENTMKSIQFVLIVQYIWSLKQIPYFLGIIVVKFV